MNLSKKYRPIKFNDILGQDDTIQILQNQVARKRVGASYLFLGPSGSGKTSTARALAMAVNCESPRKGNACGKCNSCQSMLRGANYDILEFDVGSYRGIDNIKQIEMSAKFMPFGKRKIYILDEIHALTSIAWDATLKMLEDSNDYMLFILCASEDKIPEVARSRCQEFIFHRLDARTITQKLNTISQKERLGLDLTSLRFIAEFSGGNMRTAEMYLTQAVNLNHGKPKLKQVKRFLERRKML